MMSLCNNVFVNTMVFMAWLDRGNIEAFNMHKSINGWQQSKLLVATTSSSPLYASSIESDENEAARQLFDRAAKLREEIAQLEGKSIEQVETEARTKKQEEMHRRAQQQKENVERQLQKEVESKSLGVDDGRFLQLPSTADDMIRQSSQAIERAFNDGITRQTVRLALINPDETGENEQFVSDEENLFPGGAKQMYREAGKPLTDLLLRSIYAPTTDQAEVESRAQHHRVPPKVTSQDIWDFDGSAIHTAEAAFGPKGDVQALVFPNTDVKYINDIDKISNAMGPRLFLLINPFWRNVDSWGMNILAPGAKKKAQSVIFDNGYDETYILLRYMVRGEKCAAIKAYPYDWQLFAYIEEDDFYGRPSGMERVIRLGSCKERPTSAFVTELLNERPEFKETKTMRQMKKMKF